MVDKIYHLKLKVSSSIPSTAAILRSLQDGYWL